MNSTVIDGNLFKKLITNGTIALRNDHQRINELNVFPVPDGDTGSNMQSTMMSGVKSISAFEDESTEKVAKALSRGLLMGARGNSGVILSQLFSGFAKTFKDLTVASPIQFVEGLSKGVKQAYGAVINPVEGTILTVAREAADKALEYFKVLSKPTIKKININIASFKEVLSIVYIDYELTKKIFNYRDEVAEIQSLEELKKIDGFPIEKFNRITLYLVAE